MRELKAIRQDISELDKQIRALFLKRMEYAEEIADYKLISGGKVLVPERENQILADCLGEISDDLTQEYTSFLRTTTRVSRKHQYRYMLERKPELLSLPLSPRNRTPQIVCYQGLPASYQDAAAKTLFPNAEHVYVKQFEDVFRMVRDGQAQAGVVPVENSTVGTINEVCDLLVKYQLYISHSHVSSIRLCLAGCKGATSQTVRTACSIAPALGQCEKYLAKWHFAARPMENTAVAAQYVSAQQDITLAAVCSAEAAKLYGLNILEDGINDDKLNQTRFIAVVPDLSAEENDNRVSILCMLPHVRGSLASALAIFADNQINLTEIHSRPLAENPWNYRFYLDFSGSLADASTRRLIYQLKEELPYIRLLGSYHVSTFETNP